MAQEHGKAIMAEDKEMQVICEEDNKIRRQERCGYELWLEVMLKMIRYRTAGMAPETGRKENHSSAS